MKKVRPHRYTLTLYLLYHPVPPYTSLYHPIPPYTSYTTLYLLYLPIPPIPPIPPYTSYTFLYYPIRHK